MPSGLFANQRETNLASTVALVEAVLVELGHRPSDCKVEDRTAIHSWEFTKGSSVSRVSVIHRSRFTHIRVSASVLTMDVTVDRLSLYSHLLELNAGLCGAAFAIDGNRVFLVGERSTLDLDHSEVQDLLKRITTYADEHDEVLVARFGGRTG